MDSILQSDLFFFITSIAVVVFTGVLVAVLVYFFTVLRDLKHLVRKVKMEIEEFQISDLFAKIFSRKRKLKIKH